MTDKWDKGMGEGGGVLGKGWIKFLTCRSGPSGSRPGHCFSTRSGQRPRFGVHPRRTGEPLEPRERGPSRGGSLPSQAREGTETPGPGSRGRRLSGVQEDPSLDAVLATDPHRALARGCRVSGICPVGQRTQSLLGTKRREGKRFGPVSPSVSPLPAHSISGLCVLLTFGLRD